MFDNTVLTEWKEEKENGSIKVLVAVIKQFYFGTEKAFHVIKIYFGWKENILNS